MTAGARLFLLGALPPPRGGASTHLERLLPYLEEAGMPYTIWDHTAVPKRRDHLILLRREPWRALRSCLAPGRKILYHPLSRITTGKAAGLLLMRLAGMRLILLLAASPEQTLGGSRLKRLCLSAVARFSFRIIAANAAFRDFLVGCGIDAQKISVIPPFIPLKDAAAKEPPLAAEAEAFCAARKPLLVTYANGPDIHEGLDLYGLDLMVPLVLGLQADFPDIGVVIVIPQIVHERNFARIEREIHLAGLERCFHFAAGFNVSFVRFLPHADVFVRATNTDGDALTLREALHYGVPAVASDVTQRPAGTRLFRNRDAGHLCRVVTEALRAGKRGGDAGAAAESNSAVFFLDVFREAAGLKERTQTVSAPSAGSRLRSSRHV